MLAFNIWSPRLAFADSGIRILGLFNAEISQMLLAPALDIIMSAIAKKSFISFQNLPIIWV